MKPLQAPLLKDTYLPHHYTVDTTVDTIVETNHRTKQPVLEAATHQSNIQDLNMLGESMARTILPEQAVAKTSPSFYRDSDPRVQR